MGSVITNFPDIYDQTSIFGTKRKLPIYMQFQQGVVTKVVTSKQSDACSGKLRNINSIIAQPHILPEGVKRKEIASEENRYFPLFRGMVDVPMVGDPVMLCTIGGVNYYLGPLNTAGLPNYNPDLFIGDNIQNSKTESKTENEEKGLSTNFKSIKVQRLHKPFKNKLDNPNDDNTSLTDSYGDLLLEGRYGNSLRIGSRNVNPYIILSNGRNFNTAVESSLDGSIFSMFEYGSIRNHFNEDGLSISAEEETEKYLFRLADSEIEEPKRHIQFTYSKGIGRGLGVKGAPDSNITETIYGYNGNQIFQNSDRITINARKDCIFLSAFKHIHMGSGNSMTFSTSNNILMEAETTLDCNIGEKVTITSPKIDLGGDAIEPLVLGDMLVDWLSRLLDDIGSIAGITTATGGLSGPISSATNWSTISKGLMDELKTILSKQNRTL